MTMRVEGDTQDLDEFVDGLSSDFKKTMARGVLKAAMSARGHIVRSIKKHHPGGTGGLWKSFKERFLGEGRDGSIEAAADSELVYAGIINDGGTIRPKTVKHLAVPLDAYSKRRWPRDRSDLTLIPRKGKPSLLAIVSKRKGKDHVKPQYILKKEVTIDGSGYIEDAEDMARPDISDILGEEVDTLITNRTKDGNA